MDKKDIDYVCNALRRATVKWPGRTDCIKKNRRKVYTGKTVKDNKVKTRYEVRCCKCKGWFKPSGVEVDHIEEIGGFKGDFNEFIERMYCDASNLQTLCVQCHSKKTSNYNAARIYKRKIIRKEVRNK